MASIEEEIAEHEARWDAAMEKNDELPDGLVEGKVVTFPVADGKAAYEVVEIGEDVSRVEYRDDLCLDGYRSQAVNRGRIFTDTLENACKRMDFTLANFS